MIDLITWRFRIGAYRLGKRMKEKKLKTNIPINSENGLTTKIFVAICVLCFVFHALLKMKNLFHILFADFEIHVNPFIAYLLIIGGVETNPGPLPDLDSKCMKKLFMDQTEHSDGEMSNSGTESELESSDELMEEDTSRSISRKRHHDSSNYKEPITKHPKHDSGVDETTFSTNFIRMEINSETDKAVAYKDLLLRNICALANSGGGVLFIENTAKDSRQRVDAKFSDFDNIMENCKQWLNGIGHTGFENLVEFKPPTIETDNFLLIFVHGSQFLVTTRMNTYDAQIKKNEKCLKTENMLNFIKQIMEFTPTKSSMRKPNPVSVIKEEVVHYQQRHCESNSMEYKGCQNIKSLKALKSKISEKSKDRLVKYVCIFTKNAKGGSIIYGITESGTTNKIYRVEGINCPIARAEESSIEDYCKKDIKDNTLWLTYDGKKLKADEIDEYIRVIFHPVKFAGIIGNIKLLEIAVASFQGIVFSSSCGPESWYIDPSSDDVSQFTAVDWYRHMRKHVHEDDNVLSKKLSKLKIERASVRDVHVFELENSISQIQKKVFRREVDLFLMPEVLLENLYERNDMFQQTMEDIQSFYKGENGVVVADRRFLSVINKNCKNIEVCKTCHVCDCLVISTQKPVVFLSMVAFNESKSHLFCKQMIKRYCHQSAKMVKLILSQYTDIKFAICQGLMDLEHCNVEETLESILYQYEYYTDTFKKTHAHPSLERKRVFELCKALTLASSIIPSSFQFSIGESFIESLTNEKYKITLNEDQQHFIWKTYDCDGIVGVNGFPGTGKTYVAKSFLQKLINQGADPNSILFFAKEIPLCEHIRKLFDVVTLTYNELINEHSKNKNFGKNIKYIIVDDAQLIEGMLVNCKDGKQRYKWFHILQNIYNSREIGDRKFIIFFGSHHYKTEVKELTRLVDINIPQTFTKIVRNSRSIARFAAKRMSNIDFQKAVDNIGHKFEGDVVKQKTYKLNSEEDYINAIDNELNVLLEMNVRHGDIAVLFMNIDDIPESLNCISFERKCSETLKYELEFKETIFKFPTCGKIKICSGDHNEHKTHLVVDSVKRYSSLERPVVIGVGVSKNFKKPNEKLQGLCYTRPLVKLVVIKTDEV